MPSGVQTCARSEEHTSELQSHDNLVCRLLLEKKKTHPVPPCPRPPPRARTTHAGLSRRLPEAHRAAAALRDQTAEHAREFDRVVFFFNVAATPEISPLPQPDALPV